ncbi:MAG: hypothetical protein AAGL89_16610 [Pseudomonadota bacterium]
MVRLVFCFVFSLLAPQTVAQPYSGTTFIAPEILTADDPTTYLGIRYAGTFTVDHFDARRDGYVDAEFFRFVTRFADGQLINMDMNAAFGSTETAEEVAVIYAEAFGRIPQILREDVRTIIVHEAGDEWYALPGEITVHFGSYKLDLEEGVIEESMIHEGVHASLDRLYDNAPGWRAAQRNDWGFISNYAEENPRTEDLAETFTLYVGLTLYPERLSPGMKMAMKKTVPHRLEYLRRTFPPSELTLLR